jgi:multiple sugar transport system permease protein
LLIPAAIIALVTLFGPLYILGNLAFRDSQLATLDEVLRAGFTTRYLESVLSDPGTWNSLRVSAIYVVGTTSVAFMIGLGTALLLKEAFPGRRIFRTLLLVPWAVPSITATVAFLWMMTPTFGVVNYILRTLGITDTDINWFGDPSTAMFAVIGPTAWKSYPFFAMVLLAGLQTIPKELYDAAAVDGAGTRSRFTSITWPGLKPYALLALLFGVMGAFREFDFIYASTRGGPSGTTETVAMRIFNEGFESFRLGTAAALGLVTFVVVALIAVLILRWQVRSSEDVAQ